MLPRQVPTNRVCQKQAVAYPPSGTSDYERSPSTRANLLNSWARVAKARAAAHVFGTSMRCHVNRCRLFEQARPGALKFAGAPSIAFGATRPNQLHAANPCVSQEYLVCYPAPSEREQYSPGRASRR
eukprot:229099-Chlamydomonas_euryale.AAC.6